MVRVATGAFRLIRAVFRRAPLPLMRYLDGANVYVEKLTVHLPGANADTVNDWFDLLRERLGERVRFDRAGLRGRNASKTANTSGYEFRGVEILNARVDGRAANTLRCLQDVQRGAGVFLTILSELWRHSGTRRSTAPRRGRRASATARRWARTATRAAWPRV